MTKKISGIVIPVEGGDLDDDEADEAAIQYLIDNGLLDLTYDTHPVYPIKVPCTGNEVMISDEIYEIDKIKKEEGNLIQKIMENKKMTKKNLQNHHSEVARKMTLYLKHSQNLAHSIVFRKCHPNGKYSCLHCKTHSTRGSEALWSCLPLKESGGLWFDCESDPNNEGHYRTLLDLLDNIQNLKIVPDGQFSDVQRCQVILVIILILIFVSFYHLYQKLFQEKGCLVTYKSEADAERHARLAHDKKHADILYLCKFKIDGKACGASFKSKWFLTRHKDQTGHIIRRVPKGL